MQELGATDGTFCVQLASPIPGRFPTIPRPAEFSNCSTAKFQCTPDAFIAQHVEVATLPRQLKNFVKKCPACEKQCAVNLTHCNNCTADLQTVAVTASNNVFMGFVYGIERGPFPFTISIRLQTPSLLVFDDLLSMSPFHINAIPTTAYIPNMLSLLKRPAEGRAIMQHLFEACFSVFEQQFWSVEEWRRRVFRNCSSLEGPENVLKRRQMMITGVNMPPSQFQLHLQFMAPPLTPFHQYVYLQGGHYTHKRFFPYNYVDAVLSLNRPLPAGLDVDGMIAYYTACGVDYDKYFWDFYKNTAKLQRACSNWSAADFQAVVMDDRSLVPLRGGEAKTDTDALKRVRDADKLELQNYGRPYVDGKPTGVYYRYAKSVGDVVEWAD